MRLAKERQPQILFGENVAGLLNHEGGVTFGIIISTMAELGYSVEWQVLDSQNFGVPQHRERVFIIGHLGGRGAGKVFPIREDGAAADGIQRQQRNNRVISNTLAAGDRNAIGTYVATDRQTDRQRFLKVNGYHKL
jgi:DNA (cytosine-5)-methyltransferase 1